MSEHVNTFVMRGGSAYRVAFDTVRRRPMIVCRKTKHGETPLNMQGPTGAAVIEAARRQIWPAPVDAASPAIGTSSRLADPLNPLGRG